MISARWMTNAAAFNLSVTKELQLEGCTRKVKNKTPKGTVTDANLPVGEKFILGKVNMTQKLNSPNTITTQLSTQTAPTSESKEGHVGRARDRGVKEDDACRSRSTCAPSYPEFRERAKLKLGEVV